MSAPLTPERLAVALLALTLDLAGPLAQNHQRIERHLMSAATAVCRSLRSPHEEAAWMAAATIAVAAVAAEGQPFTSDEVWGHLDAHHPSLAPPDPRAMGAAFTQSQRRGLITPTDVTRRSGRPTNHRPVRIWQPTKGDNT